MDPKQIQFIKSVLSHVEEFKVDWDEVMMDNGLSRRDNTVTKFKNMLKKHGVDFSNNKFTIQDEGDTVAGETSAATPKTPKISKPKTPRKRKADTNGDVSNESTETPASSSKKRKPKKEEDECKVEMKEEVATSWKDETDSEQDRDLSPNTNEYFFLDIKRRLKTLDHLD